MHTSLGNRGVEAELRVNTDFGICNVTSPVMIGRNEIRVQEYIYKVTKPAPSIFLFPSIPSTYCESPSSKNTLRHYY